jgi:hypothetical protein
MIVHICFHIDISGTGVKRNRDLDSR